MAVTLAKSNLSIDLGNIVASAVTSIRAERSSAQSKNEAEFQKAIANGMSYSDQVAFRQKQMDEENASSFKDDNYITSLQTSISSTKKLARFADYRTKYAQNLTSLTNGLENHQQYLDNLKSSLDGVTDSDLRLEIQGNIATATQDLKTYNDTILSNQVKKAQHDGTKSILTDAIAKVSSAKLTAQLNDDQEAVTAHDETLAALNQQLSTAKVNDSVSDFRVTSATKGTGAMDKLSFLNGQASSADATSPINIGGVAYASAQDYWTKQRDGYLAGTSQTFGDFFKEMTSASKNTVDSATSKFGFPPQGTLDSVSQTFKDLASKPEFAPFAANLTATQSAVMSYGVDKLASAVVDASTNNLDFKNGDTTLDNVSKRYGVDTSGYRTTLQNKLVGLAQGNVITRAEASTMAPDFSPTAPKVEKPTATTPAPIAPVAPASPTGEHLVVGGDTLSSIAKKNGVTLAQVLDANPQYKANPNSVGIGQKVVIPTTTAPTAPVAPVVPDNKPTLPTPASPMVAPPPTAPTPPPTPAATPPVAPPTATPPTNAPPVSATQATLYGANGVKKAVTVGSPEASDLQSKGWGLTPGSFKQPATPAPVAASAPPTPPPSESPQQTMDRIRKEQGLPPQ